ncbi:hypothetical protein GCM10022225_64050 [Plantactinospora mayteni]|uniref:WXG100 family type VII secretion target n=1 Tax=Plantactinospora mayteni TaxID=566021 RepID=A0ABQ4F0A2_9ACTN|nr:PE domain-containing protein [Plantactinospora mayteni]GIH00334.1 hypothetical protein Pma05_69060 [Plantactinospora mayteni]
MSYVTHVPDPDAALTAAGRLNGVGERLSTAMARAVAALDAAGDPWGNDEIGQEYRNSFAATAELKVALTRIAESVSAFGAVASTSVDTLIEVDLRTRKLLGENGHRAT